ncbi:hypothetical protein ABT300_23310 [Streptomyces sp. NPDC001027]|uniref:hypothetical protein n=1 Tax=Streptomyces sp. NPDC001027 TaxID=3154771 RepID=UPI00331A93A4
MRLSRSLAPATVVALCLVFALPYDASPHARVKAPGTAAPEPFGAECLVGVHGSRVVAHCHNPYADTDRVRLHIECDRWWDLDTDGAPADAGPARTVRLTGRCWKEVRSAWVTHQRV